MFLEIGNKLKTGHFFIVINENGKCTQNILSNQTDSYIIKNCICEVNYPTTQNGNPDIPNLPAFVM